MTEETNNQAIAIVDGLISRPAKETVALIKNALDGGETDPAYVGVVLKKFAKVQELANKDSSIKELIHNETIKHQVGTTKTFALHGAKITIANTGFWDYSNTDDKYLEALQDIEKQVKELIKHRKEEVQNKVALWESKNNPLNVSKFGVKPFELSWDELPTLEWDGTYGEVDTNPPIKKGKETLRYSV